MMDDDMLNENPAKRKVYQTEFQLLNSFQTPTLDMQKLKNDHLKILS